jgi:hypothetical protein
MAYMDILESTAGAYTLRHLPYDENIINRRVELHFLNMVKLGMEGTTVHGTTPS